MSKRKKLKKSHKKASGLLREVKALLEGILNLEQGSYPTNTLAVIAQNKVLQAFFEV